LGWVDCQLLASAKAMRANLWTQDRALKRAWRQLSESI
jgi:predicted nucleic acid-binding protein